MARKRKRRTLKPAPVLAFLLLANIGLGFSYSRITSATRARVVGAAPFDRPRLEEIMKRMADRPVGGVSPRRVETEALKIPEALDADFARNIFGRAELKMRYRVPVARLDGHPDQLMDEDGSIYASRQVVQGLPTLHLPEEDSQPSLSLVNSWPSQAVATLCKRIPRQLPRETCVVEVLSKGGLCLNIGQSGRVVFGSTGQLDEKLNRLETLLKGNPQLVTEIKEINLTAPSKPVMKPLTMERNP